MPQNVAILGASDRPDRFAFKAYKMLKKYGHRTFPVSPTLATLEGGTVYKKLKDIPDAIETLTLYVGPAISNTLIQDIVALKPGRVIFNPGTENPSLERELSAAAIPYRHACTLVMLGSDDF